MGGWVVGGPDPLTLRGQGQSWTGSTEFSVAKAVVVFYW